MPRPTCPQDLCLLVVSCDKYADCWEPFSLCLQKFWPDCPYPVYLATETKDAPAHTVYQKALHSKNPSWTGRLREICQQIAEPYIFIVLEDHWLAAPLATETVRAPLQLFSRTPDLGVIYFDYPVRNKLRYPLDSSYYVIPPGAPYRFSAGPSIWRKDFLLLACAEDADAWNFERVKSFSPATFSYTVLTCADSRYPRIHPAGAIQRGKWQTFVAKFAKENGFSIDFSARKTMSPLDNFKISAKSFVYNLNPALIVKVQNGLYHLRHKEN